MNAVVERLYSLINLSRARSPLWSRDFSYRILQKGWIALEQRFPLVRGTTVLMPIWDV